MRIQKISILGILKIVSVHSTHSSRNTCQILIDDGEMVIIVVEGRNKDDRLSSSKGILTALLETLPCLWGSPVAVQGTFWSSLPGPPLGEGLFPTLL